jgi:hypothetical protein
MSPIERWDMSECPDCGVLTCATAEQVQWCDEHCRSNPTVVKVVRADAHAGAVARGDWFRQVWANAQGCSIEEAERAYERALRDAR